MKTVLVDIDGTLANIEHRRPFLDETPANWAAFNARMDGDTPNWPVVNLYKALWVSQAYNLVLLTGRNERFRKVTEQWLFWNEIPFGRLLMRADGDSRADNIIKEEILASLRAEGLEIELAIDDRQQVVDMWRDNGITCLQCDVGDF